MSVQSSQRNLLPSCLKWCQLLRSFWLIVGLGCPDSPTLKIKIRAYTYFLEYKAFWPRWHTISLSSQIYQPKTNSKMNWELTRVNPWPFLGAIFCLLSLIEASDPQNLVRWEAAGHIQMLDRSLKYSTITYTIIIIKYLYRFIHGRKNKTYFS